MGADTSPHSYPSRPCDESGHGLGARPMRTDLRTRGVQQRLDGGAAFGQRRQPRFDEFCSRKVIGDVMMGVLSIRGDSHPIGT